MIDPVHSNSSQGSCNCGGTADITRDCPHLPVWLVEATSPGDHVHSTLQGPEEHELLQTYQGLSGISAEKGYEEPLINALTH